MLGTEVLDEIKRRALKVTADLEAKNGKFSAEILPGVIPQWHLIETMTGQEDRASGYLAGRHFGVFMPKFSDDATLMMGDTEVCSGRRLIFPGHLFLFVWDIEAHWRRVRNCPGVIRILMDRHEHPVVVSDSAIDFIQALQFGLSPSPMTKRRRLKARHQRYVSRAEEAVDDVILTTRSYWTAIDSEVRISRLHQALGLAMLTPIGAEATMPS